MAKIITLTTDFGLRDPWVGLMKGVMLGIDPEIQFVDISHSVPPQDIRRAAICLAGFGDYFPPGTVHLVVVDPGVGSNREPVIVKTRRYFFVGPNNGIFSLLDSPVEKVVEITNTEIISPRISTTFHGRDIFAPAAANLFSHSMEEFGEPVEELERIYFPPPGADDGEINGEVVYIDHFGNLFTNITSGMIFRAQDYCPDCRFTLEVEGAGTIDHLSYYYQSVKNGALGAVVNSFDRLELFTPNGNAARLFNLKEGAKVKLVFKPENRP